MRRLASVVIALSLGLTACAESAPEAPLRSDGTADPELQIGRQIYTESCKSCHGAAGDRRSGSDLSELDADGKTPDFDRLIDIVAEGRRRMPGYSSVLSEKQISAVVRYLTEVL